MNREKILIAGGGGFVGGHVAEKAVENRIVHVVDSAYKSGLSNGVVWHVTDILNSERLEHCVHHIEPDAIVITAAISNIDYAQQHQEKAFDINVKAAGRLAALGEKAGARVVFLSSDAVYDGKSDLASEDQPMNPVNYYGKTKMLGEAAVLQACPQAVILRLSLVLGRSYTAGNSFVEKLEQQLKSGGIVESTDQEIRTPIDVKTLAETILLLIDRKQSGVFNIGNQNAVSRYELTQQLAVQMGFSAEQIVLKSYKKSPEDRAPRHQKGILSVEKIEKTLNIKMKTLEKTIERATEKLD